MISPRARAVRIVRWLMKKGEGFEGVESSDLEDRIAEEIAEALDELREGFLRKPTHAPTVKHAPRRIE